MCGGGGKPEDMHHFRGVPVLRQTQLPAPSSHALFRAMLLLGLASASFTRLTMISYNAALSASRILKLQAVRNLPGLGPSEGSSPWDARGINSSLLVLGPGRFLPLDPSPR